MMSECRRDGILGQAPELIYFPARLLLRKLGGEGSEYFAGPGNLTVLSQTEKSASKHKRSDDRRDRSPQLFDLCEESIEILAFGTMLFSQSGLHQTSEAKSVVNTHYTATMRALVVLVLRCPKRISKAV